MNIVKIILSMLIFPTFSACSILHGAYYQDCTKHSHLHKYLTDEQKEHLKHCQTMPQSNEAAALE